MIRNLLHRIVAQPVVYNALQRVCGSETSLRKLRAVIGSADPGTVLDIGAGTGNGLRALPPCGQYVWLDIDPQKLDGLRNSGQQAVIRAVLGSATDIPLRSRSVDTALCIAMSHHLDDREVEKLFAEISRVCRGRMIFVDPVERSSSLASRILWKYDRGSHPRSVDVLRRLVQDKFDILHEERYAIFHEYWLCAARPR